MGPKLEKRKSVSELVTAYKSAGDPPDSSDGETAKEWYKKFVGADLPEDGTKGAKWDEAVKNYEKAMEFAGDD